MAKKKEQITAATRHLKSLKIPFEPFFYQYEERGGTRVAAAALGVPESCVIKTLVMENQDGEAFIVLMHGDREVSTKQLARHLSYKSVETCEAKNALKHTGYLTGGTSPFGTRKALKVYIEASIMEEKIIYINGGLRGFLVSFSPAELKKLDYEFVTVAN